MIRGESVMIALIGGVVGDRHRHVLGLGVHVPR